MPKRERYVTLDGMRGIAALAVAIHHFGYPTLPGAYLAVDFFFLLSGFVLSRTYGERLAQGMRFGEFAGLRLVRLYPIHLIGFLLGTAWFLLGWVRHWEQPLTLAMFAVDGAFNLVMLPTPFSANLSPVNGPAWTLFLELAASLALPAIIAPRSNKALMTGCAVVGGILAWFCIALEGNGLQANATSSAMNLGFTWDAIHIGLLRTMFSFPLGILIGRFGSDSPRPRTHLALLAMLLLVALLSARFMGMAHAIYDIACVLFLFPAILWVAARMEPTAIVAKGARFLGDISFALYAVHLTFCKLVWYELEQKHNVPGFIAVWVYLALSIGFAWVIAAKIDPLARRYLGHAFGINRGVKRPVVAELVAA